MNELIGEKFGVYPTRNVLDLIRTYFKDKGIPPPSSNRQLQECMLLDDFPTGALMSAAKQYGPMLLAKLWEGFGQPLYNKYVQPRIDQYSKILTGHDQGLWLGDMSQNNVGQPSKMATIPGLNTGGLPYYQPKMKRDYHINSINSDYIATLLCPQKFAYRQPLPLPQQVALATGSYQVQIYSNASGQALAYVNPQNPSINSSDASTNISVLTSGNTSTINTTNGSITNPIKVSGPLSGAPVDQYQTVGYSVMYVPTNSVNNASGSVQLAYFQNYNAGGALPAISQNMVMQSPYYQTGNMLATYRGIRLPEPYGNLQPSTLYTPFQHGFVMYIVGAPPTAVIGKLVITYVYHTIPIGTSYNLMPQDYPRPGIRTADCICSMLQIMPGIQLLTLPDAYTLANTIASTATIYQEACDATVEFCSKH